MKRSSRPHTLSLSIAGLVFGLQTACDESPSAKFRDGEQVVWVNQCYGVAVSCDEIPPATNVSWSEPQAIEEHIGKPLLADLNVSMHETLCGTPQSSDLNFSDPCAVSLDDMTVSRDGTIWLAITGTILPTMEYGLSVVHLAANGAVLSTTLVASARDHSWNAFHGQLAMDSQSVPNVLVSTTTVDGSADERASDQSWLQKIDPVDGRPMAAIHLDGMRAHSFALAANDDAIVAGASTVRGRDIILARLTSEGDLVWSKTNIFDEWASEPIFATTVGVNEENEISVGLHAPDYASKERFGTAEIGVARFRSDGTALWTSKSSTWSAETIEGHSGDSLVYSSLWTATGELVFLDQLLMLLPDDSLTTKKAIRMLDSSGQPQWSIAVAPGFAPAVALDQLTHAIYFTSSGAILELAPDGQSLTRRPYPSDFNLSGAQIMRISGGHIYGASNAMLQRVALVSP